MAEQTKYKISFSKISVGRVEFGEQEEKDFD